jgi:hypothetical protein
VQGGEPRRGRGPWPPPLSPPGDSFADAVLDTTSTPSINPVASA